MHVNLQKFLRERFPDGRDIISIKNGFLILEISSPLFSSEVMKILLFSREFNLLFHIMPRESESLNASRLVIYFSETKGGEM